MPTTDGSDNGQEMRGTLAPQPFVESALLEVVADVPEGRVLDPWVTNGIALRAALQAPNLTAGVGICRDRAAMELTSAATAGTGVDLKYRDKWPTAENELSPSRLIGLRSDERFACVVSIPPRGFRVQQRDASKPLRRSPIVEVIIASCSLLANDGLGVFVMPEAELLRGNRWGMRRIEESGLHIGQVLALPPGSFAPATQAGGALVAVEKSRGANLFCATLTKQREVNQRIIERGREHVVDRRELALGTVYPTDEFNGVEAIVASEVFSRSTRSIERPKVDLASLCVEVAPGRRGTSFTERENAVYLPLIGDGAAHHRIDDLTMKHQNYVQLVVDGERVRPPWLAGYLSSPLGVQARRSVAVGLFIRRLSRSNLGGIPVLLPSISEQDAAIEAEQSLRLVLTRLDQWRSQLWVSSGALEESQAFLDRQEETFSEWIAQLQFPLATILWAYHAAGEDDKARYEHLLHFFEAAGFYATILLSAVEQGEEVGRDLLRRVKQQLAQQHLSFERATFGTWNVTFASLAKSLRTLLHDVRGGGREYVESLLKVRDASALEMLLSKRMVSIFEAANAYRNNWTGHGGVGALEAKNRHSKLREELVRFRETVSDGWTRYELVMPLDMRFLGNRYAVRMQRVRGAATPFEQTEVDLAAPPRYGRLHLLGTGEREVLSLLPLVQMMPSPQTAANACYFYNRRDDDMARSVSYHFATDAEVLDVFPEVNATLQRLSLDAA